MHASLLVPDVTCWRKSRADRYALVVDAGPYYAALADAIDRAERQILVLAWDIDTRTPVRRDDATGRHTRLLDVLVAALERSPALEIFILCWDFHLVYSLDRERDPHRAFPPHVASRVHVRFDCDHPKNGSHHQKVVVVDGRIAFVGGLDVAQGRWDTRSHPAEDAFRVRTDGKPYIPYHDAMSLVDGPVVADLAELFRERWRRCRNGNVELQVGQSDPWPGSVEPLAHDVPVALSRTDPSHSGRPEVLEIRELLLAGIARARRLVYMETQYFSSPALATALALRLEEPDGPEVVLVVPRRYGGYIERHTVGARQADLIRYLKKRDVHGRFHALSPMSDAPSGKHIHVHAKILVIDDEVFDMGSANLNERSLGYDTEVNITIDAGEFPPARRDEARTLVASMRDDLMAEHLGVPVEEWRGCLAASGGKVTPAFLRVRRPAKTLEAADDGNSLVGMALARCITFADPKRPSPYNQPLLGEAEGASRRVVGRKAKSSAWGLYAIVGLCLALVAAWRFTPAKEFLDVARISALGDAVWGHDAGPFLLTLAIFLASTFMVPVNLLTAAMAVALAPWPAVITTFVGSFLSAIAVYLVGRNVGSASVEKLAARFKQKDLTKRLGRTGLVPVILLRILPIAPFTLMNLALGAARIPPLNYAVGTAIALLPGKIAVVFFAAQIKAFIAKPADFKDDPGVWATGTGVVALSVGILWYLKRSGLTQPRRSLR